jgi:hypothetical protein
MNRKRASGASARWRRELIKPGCCACIRGALLAAEKIVVSRLGGNLERVDEDDGHGVPFFVDRVFGRPRAAPSPPRRMLTRYLAAFDRAIAGDATVRPPDLHIA